MVRNDLVHFAIQDYWSSDFQPSMAIDDLVHFAIQDYWSSDFQPAWSEMIWFILLYRIIGPVILNIDGHR